VVGHESAADGPGQFGGATEAACRAFQQARGLRIDGICGQQTWAALVEAGYRLGDRLLYRRFPPLRGDDVADLQRRLSTLGFDTGRVDGILGERTEHALADFQRNAGLTVDGICGPTTLDTLDRLGRRAPPQPVAPVREQADLRHGPRTLQDRRVVVAEGGGLDALARELERALVATGALVTVLHHPDGSTQAAAANAAAADVFIGVAVDPDAEGCSTAYYAGHGGASTGGRRLAELLQAAVPDALDVKDGGTRGMAVPALRETRMPAVLCELGPPSAVVERAAELAAAVTAALARWAAAPCD
jgi:N-acetylmuramoyl-L-alanine amidase